MHNNFYFDLKFYFIYFLISELERGEKVAEK